MQAQIQALLVGGAVVGRAEGVEQQVQKWLDHKYLMGPHQRFQGLLQLVGYI